MIRHELPVWVMASPKENNRPLVSIFVTRGYLLRRRVYVWNMDGEELKTSAYYNLMIINRKMYFILENLNLYYHNAQSFN